MSHANIWWTLAAGLAALELASGTFYLLMLAVGPVAAALGAYAGLGVNGQMFLAALVSSGTVAVWHLYGPRARARNEAQDQSALEQGLDVGATVQVASWQEDQTTRVPYRGSIWTAKYEGEGEPLPGAHTVTGLAGTTLLLNKKS